MSTLQNVEKPPNPMRLFGGSFAVWPTGNSIDFKICLREKASGQKGRELDGGDMDGGKRAETFPRATIDVPHREGWKMAGESAASKMCGPFLRHKPVVSDDNNEDAAQW